MKKKSLVLCILILVFFAACNDDMPCPQDNHCGTTHYPAIGLSLTISCKMAKCRTGTTGGCNCPSDPSKTGEKLKLED